jgi:hypothetical protein
MSAALEQSKQDPIPACYSRIISPADLSPMTADLCGVLTPRLRGTSIAFFLHMMSQSNLHIQALRVTT